MSFLARYWDPTTGQFVDCDYVDGNDDCKFFPYAYGTPGHRRVRRPEPVRPVPKPVVAREVIVHEPVRQQMNQERMACMRANIVNVIKAPLAEPPANRLPRDGSIAKALAIAVSQARV